MSQRRGNKRKRIEYNEKNAHTNERIDYAGTVWYTCRYVFDIRSKEAKIKHHTRVFPVEKYANETEAKIAAQSYGETYGKEHHISHKGSILKEEFYQFYLYTPREYKRFHIRKFPSKEDAYNTAIEYQMKRSTELGMNTRCGLMNVREDVQQRTAGFLDGDGCCCLAKRENRRSVKMNMFIR